jgi:hypothetical protein
MLTPVRCTFRSVPSSRARGVGATCTHVDRACMIGAADGSAGAAIGGATDGGQLEVARILCRCGGHP